MSSSGNKTVKGYRGNSRHSPPPAKENYDDDDIEDEDSEDEDIEDDSSQEHVGQKREGDSIAGEGVKEETRQGTRGEGVAIVQPQASQSEPRSGLPRNLRLQGLTTELFEGLGPEQLLEFSKTIQSDPTGPKAVFVVAFRSALQKHNKEPNWFPLSDLKSSSNVLGEIIFKAEKRFLGVPMTAAEHKEDEKILANKILADRLRDYGGFIGVAISNASNDFGSGPRVLMYSFIMVFTLFLLAGPEQMVPYLMEIVCTIIPAQCMLYAIAALRHDFNKDKGERGTVGGNVNQRLWYCVFWCWTHSINEYFHIIRPNWYRGTCAIRTVLLCICHSPFFGDFVHNPDDAVIAQYRRTLLKEVWQRRGQRVQHEGLTSELLFPWTKTQQFSRSKHKHTTKHEEALVVKNIETKLKFLMGVLQEMLTNSDDFIMVPFGRKRKVLKNVIRSNLETVWACWQELAKKKPSDNFLKWNTRTLEDHQKWKEYEGTVEEHSKSISRIQAFLSTEPVKMSIDKWLRWRFGATKEEVELFLDTQREEESYLASLPDGKRKLMEMDQWIWQQQFTRRGLEHKLDHWISTTEAIERNRPSKFKDGIEKSVEAFALRERNQKLRAMKLRGDGSHLDATKFDWLSPRVKVAETSIYNRFSADGEIYSELPEYLDQRLRQIGVDRPTDIHMDPEGTRPPADAEGRREWWKRQKAKTLTDRREQALKGNQAYQKLRRYVHSEEAKHYADIRARGDEARIKGVFGV